MSLCLCAEAASEWRRRRWIRVGSPLALCPFFLFFLVSEPSSASPQRDPPPPPTSPLLPPLLGETKGAFSSEELSDVGGACECGPCVRAAAAAAAAQPWCLHVQILFTSLYDSAGGFILAAMMLPIDPDGKFLKFLLERPA